MSAAAPLLTLRRVRKEFPGVVALDDVDFEVRAGEVHALLGENGAGKSTLIKVLTGVYQRDGGEMALSGETLSPQSVGEAQSAGISTVYQEVNLLPNLSVAQNLMLGREPRRFGLTDWKRMNAEARDTLKRFRLDIDVTRPLEQFSVAIQQLVAIARGVEQRAKILVLDEPTASLDAGEVEVLFDILRGLRDDGLGIIFVTHFLDQVYALSDRITVLRNGEKIGTFETAVLPRPKLVEHMLGYELQGTTAGHASRRAVDGAKDAALDVQGACVEGSVQEISLTALAGEAIGLAGLLGSGRTEVCRALFGLDTLSDGKIRCNGEIVQINSPRTAIAKGIALCPEDRKANGIVGELSVRENIALALQARRGWWRPIPAGEQRAMAAKAIADFKIATPDADKPVRLLSGGNQQKVILARWLAIEPDVLLLDEPTRGIDVGAHAEILRLIQQLCDRGMALVVTSSELEELVAFSHRVIVLRDFRQIAVIEGEDITEDAVLQAIAS
ncbi:MAG: sugar ABC transporter ATP-binding protein [Henriciella sp.]|uniref:sugar ABC transporter ATP-binding protein n=1 Tax=Henriciella sp. TaxID=1968823 RepID=UPI003C73E78C